MDAVNVGGLRASSLSAPLSLGPTGNTEMPEDTPTRSVDYRALAELAYVVSAGTVQPELSKDILKALTSAIGAEAGHLFILNDRRDSLQLLAFYDPKEQFRGSTDDIDLKDAKTAPGHCALNAHVLVITNAQKSHIRVFSPYIESCICVPVMYASTVIAVIALYGMRKNQFDLMDEELLTISSPLIAAYLRDYYLSIRQAQKPADILAGDRHFAFVLMPFHDPFNKYYRSIIRPAIEDAGLVSLRADEIYKPSEIIKDIYSYIDKSKLLIAELTGRNPNVLYELGYGHALGKTAVMLTQSMEDVPFDLRGYRCIVYDTTDPDWSGTLRSTLSEYIRSVG